MLPSAETPSKRKRVTSGTTAASLRQLQVDQESALRKAQIEYVWNKMHENPEVVPSLISVIDGMATMKARDFVFRSVCVASARFRVTSALS